MASEHGFATYHFLVEVVSCDYDLVTSFGYKNEEELKEAVTRNIMKNLAKMPYVMALSVESVTGLSEVAIEENNESEVEDE